MRGRTSFLHADDLAASVQKGIASGVIYRLAPKDIIHSSAEVLVDERWVKLEGVILDKGYLEGLRSVLPNERGAFLGYAVGTDNLALPAIEWRGADTSIQMTGVNQDFGTFDDPDAFYAHHGSNLSGIKRWLYRHWGRHRMNRKVASIRGKVGCANVPLAQPVIHSS